MKKAVAALLAFVLFAPMLGLLGIGALMNPATADCAAGGGSGPINVGNVPDQLQVTTADGGTFTLNKTQLTRAASIITVGSQIDGVDRDAITIALMAALTESNLRQLANTSAYPESSSYPNDGVGSDHDSLGLWQMRPQSGWGSVEELMDVDYETRAFFGGTNGPNYPSPRGLLDIPGWQQMDKGEAAQSVEVSAYPDRYRNYEPVAETILDTLSSNASTASAAPANAAPVSTTTESSRVVFPLPEGTWTMTSPFGYRIHPITGERKLHAGTDFAAADGTPIMAAADGVVTVARYTDSGGGIIVIEHTVDGKKIATAYIHMWQDGIHVQAGERVTAGQHIGDVGSSGQSTGPHLHFEVRVGGTDGDPIDSAVWLDDHGAADLPGAEPGGPGQPSDTGCSGDGSSSPGDAPGDVDGDPNRMVDDPTSDGQITARMFHVYQEARERFPDTGWGCYSPRSGQMSEHPLGRACDVTFGNAIGQRPTPQQLDDGWEVTNWMKDNAETLGVQYLIWQGKIWNIDRDDEGWRDYNGGGMHDPSDVTGGHYDHLHVTMKE